MFSLKNCPIPTKHAKLPLKTRFSLKTQFSLVLSHPIGYLDEWKWWSNSPYHSTCEGPLSEKLEFHWSSTNQWDFSTIQPKIRILRIKLLGKNHFSEKSIFIGSESTNRIPRLTVTRFELPASNYVWGTTFPKTRFSLVFG